MNVRQALRPAKGGIPPAGTRPVKPRPFHTALKVAIFLLLS